MPNRREGKGKGGKEGSSHPNSYVFVLDVLLGEKHGKFYISSAHESTLRNAAAQRDHVRHQNRKKIASVYIFESSLFWIKEF